MGFYVNQYTSSETSEIVIKDIIESGNFSIGVGYATDPKESNDEKVTSQNCYIAKYDLDGNLLWQKKYSFSEKVAGVFVKIVQLSNGNFLVLGKDSIQVWLIWIDAEGTILRNTKYYNIPTPTSGSVVFESEYIIQLANNEIVLLVKEFVYSSSSVLTTINNILIKINSSNGNLVLTRKIWKSADTKYVNITGYTVADNSIVFISNSSSLGGTSLIITISSTLLVSSRFKFSYKVSNTERFTFFDISNPSSTHLFALAGITDQSYGRGGKYLLLKLDKSTKNIVSTHQLNLSFSSTDTQNEKKQLFYNNGGLYLRTSDLVSHFTEQISLLWTKSVVDYKLDFFQPFTNKIYSTFIGNNKLQSIGRTSKLFDCCINSNSQPYLLSTINVVKTTVTDVTYTSLTNSTYTALTSNIISISQSNRLVICPLIPDFSDDTVSLQSPNFYLQSAGSTGEDSTKGIHSRWIFMGALGEKHLPKGNLAANTVNFNKPNDFVTLYRAPYTVIRATIDFSTPPQLIDANNRIWIYRMNNNERMFYVYFRNHTKYDAVKQSINPLSNPLGFVQSYGAELIEIENKSELFFAGTLEVSSGNLNSILQFEGLSVIENTLSASQSVSIRKTFTSTSFPSINWVIENGRSIRFKGIGATVNKIHFEIYSDFINVANWTSVGKFSLSLNQTEVFEKLEPSPNAVNGKWLRYNDGANVNVNNYKDKWEREAQFPDKNMYDVVDSYITLSNNINNPTAKESFSLIHEDGYPQPGDDPSDILTLSNLDILRIASNDFHFARMLGLGAMDTSATIFSGKFVYLAQYKTNADLEDGLGAREVNHLSMSLPTSLSDQRLPLPVKISEIVPGAFIGLDSPEPYSLTDEEGYTFDGKLRYVTLYSEYLSDDPLNPVFFETNMEYDKSTYTNPIYAGIEYKKNQKSAPVPLKWEKPEISHDKNYMNVDTEPNSYETVSVLIPEFPRPLFVHTHRISGIHHYDTYGINWFSRSTRANNIKDIETTLKPKNLLSPPYEINPVLIVPESPLMFTSQEEQARLNATSESNKPIVRVPFYYDSANELYSYKVPEDVANPLSPNTIFPDNEEIYAREIEIFFRNSIPIGVTGRAVNVSDHPTNPLLSIITTDSYLYLSNGNEVIPNIPPALKPNFIGGVVVMGNQSYIIQDISFPHLSGDKPIFTVYKKQVSDGIIIDTIPTLNAEELFSPEIVGDGLFTTAENMQNEYCWNNNQAFPFKVKVGDQRSDFVIHRELILKTNDSGEQEKFIEKSRGFWKNTKIEEIEEVVDMIEVVDENGNTVMQPVYGNNGLYKITFTGFKLSQHSQFSQTTNSVEWSNGVIRLFSEESFNNNGDAIKSRKLFKVVRTENIGTEQDLVVYVEDPLYNNSENDKIKTGLSILTNYYPGYKTYLYKNEAYDLTNDDSGIMPSEGEGTKYSIFGLRSVDTTKLINGVPYKSKISVPALMYAQEVIAALTPEKPKGPLYATRPDYFGRSTYTFTTKYDHKPFGVLMGRSNDEILLNAFYEKETVIEIRQNLDLLGGQNEEYFTNRWQNFFDFEGLVSLEDGENEEDLGLYGLYPPMGVGDEETPRYRLPLPNKIAFYQGINSFIDNYSELFTENLDIPKIPENQFGTFRLNDVIDNELVKPNGEKYLLIDFVKDVIYYSFVPLTEMPVVYKHILNNLPKDEKQVVRDENGYVLSPDDSRFKMAPMMKINSTVPHHSTLFTDFHLDGYSNNFYFYGVREVSSQMKLGEFSQFLGPIKLVNSNAPEAPEIKRIMPVLENSVLGILPHIQLEINRYPSIQNIRKISVYRTFDHLKAQSVRSMDLVKVIDLEDENMLDESIWLIKDYFEDLTEICYGDGVYYRLTVSRKIEYAKANYDTENSEPEIVIEYAPSKSSKISATLMVDTRRPSAPILDFEYDSEVGGKLLNVILKWEKTVYNGKYHLYKMNAQGNWVKLTELPLQTNEQSIQIALSSTNLNSGDLDILDIDGNPIYHHFKVITENTAGMFSETEKRLTIPNV